MDNLIYALGFLIALIVISGALDFLIDRKQRKHERKEK